MAVRKDNSKGKWIAEFYQNGKRIRRWFATKGEATRFFNLNSRQKENAVTVRVQEEKPEVKSLQFFIDQWFELHGLTLSDGENRKQKLTNLSDRLGNPSIDKLTPELFAEYRSARLRGKYSTDPNKPVKEATVNREHSYLRAVFNELKNLGKWQGENPIAGMRLFKETEFQVIFLRKSEITRLLAACDESRNPDLGNIVRICLSTGARWSEAETLTGSQVIPYKITYTNTKSKRNRTVPISPELYDRLPNHRRGRLFCDAYESFSWAIERAEIDLPKGQLTHVLRHTFASHFMMNGGNLIVLKDILGHSTIETTMRYAHFAPTHLESAITLNPLAQIRD